MAKAKITVLKRMSNPDIVEKYMGDEPKSGTMIPCQAFTDGQEFIVEQSSEPPKGFCNWAWVDIHKYVLTVMCGGSFSPWVKNEGGAIACCTDGYRPVVFYIERIE